MTTYIRGFNPNDNKLEHVFVNNNKLSVADDSSLEKLNNIDNKIGDVASKTLTTIQQSRDNNQCYMTNVSASYTLDEQNEIVLLENDEFSGYDLYLYSINIGAIGFSANNSAKLEMHYLTAPIGKTNTNVVKRYNLNDLGETPTSSKAVIFENMGTISSVLKDTVYVQYFTRNSLELDWSKDYIRIPPGHGITLDLLSSDSARDVGVNLKWIEVLKETYPPMPTPREGIRGASLDSCNFYVIGGKDGNSSFLDVVEKFNGTSWVGSVAPMPTPRFRMGVVEYNNELYAIGGSDNVGALDIVERYNENDNKWWAETAMNNPRDDLAVVEYDGKIFAIGGYNNGRLNVVESYDGNSWTTITPSMPTNRTGCSAVVLNNKIYVIGGHNGAFLDVVESFDGSTWTTETAMPTARANLGLVVLNGNIYAIGGKGTSFALSTVERFDGTTWTTLNSMPTARFDFAISVMDGYIYVIGGKDSSDDVINVVERFDGLKWE